MRENVKFDVALEIISSKKAEAENIIKMIEERKKSLGYDGEELNI